MMYEDKNKILRNRKDADYATGLFFREGLIEHECQTDNKLRKEQHEI